MTHDEKERFLELGRLAGRAGKGPSANPYRNSGTLRAQADLWEQGRDEAAQQRKNDRRR